MVQGKHPSKHLIIISIDSWSEFPAQREYAEPLCWGFLMMFCFVGGGFCLFLACCCYFVFPPAFTGQ